MHDECVTDYEMIMVYMDGMVRFTSVPVGFGIPIVIVPMHQPSLFGQVLAVSGMKLLQVTNNFIPERANT